jgi:hypothetical protein
VALSLLYGHARGGLHQVSIRACYQEPCEATHARVQLVARYRGAAGSHFHEQVRRHASEAEVAEGRLVEAVEEAERAAALEEGLREAWDLLAAVHDALVVTAAAADWR